MVLYVCPRCQYSSKLRNDLRRHFKRKKPCKVLFKDLDIQTCIKMILGEECKPNKSIKNTIDNTEVNSSISHIPNNYNYYQTSSESSVDDDFYECKYCEKMFNNRQARHKHQLRCEHKLKHYFTKEEVAQKLAEKDILINELRHQIGSLLEKVGDTYNTNTYNIVINPFGKENTSYITADYVNNLINSGPYNSIPKLIKYIHFHPEHKENHNVKIPNKKQSYAQIYNGSKWEYQSKRETIEKMSDRAYAILNKHYIGGNQHMHKFKSNFDDNSPELSKRLIKDIELTILNHQEMIVNK